MPEGGHRSDTEVMRSARGALEAAAGEVTGVVTQVTAADFGRVHGGAFGAYRSGFGALSDAMRAYAEQLTAFGGSLDVAAGRYADLEADRVDQIRKTGDR
ncbi:WXG100 family type VII secretion target [Amycolatopsis sp. NPDC051903]|uniref:WXG100 family type VII secretion target n=1 Tax=Amycolatopsis sp. NPDC051903 TaxID=3363936 RepID=UPI0037891873